MAGANHHRPCTRGFDEPQVLLRSPSFLALTRVFNKSLLAAFWILFPYVDGLTVCHLWNAARVHHALKLKSHAASDKPVLIPPGL